MARKCGERGWIGEGDGATLLFNAESLRQNNLRWYRVQQSISKHLNQWRLRGKNISAQKPLGKPFYFSLLPTLLKRAGLSLSPLWDSSLCPDWETSPSSPSFDSDLQGRADNPRQEIDSPPPPQFYAPLSLHYLHFQHSVWGTQEWIGEVLTNNGNPIFKRKSFWTNIWYFFPHLDIVFSRRGASCKEGTPPSLSLLLLSLLLSLHHGNVSKGRNVFPLPRSRLLWFELQCTWLDCG